MRQRFKDWLPLAEWGPVCNGCGADEFRIDGYCSIECRDFHSDEDVRDLLSEIDRLRGMQAAVEQDPAPETLAGVAIADLYGTVER